MLIKTLKIEKHAILGDLDLDFTNADKVYNTIIFAGQNGTGKSTLLNFIRDIPLYLQHKVDCNCQSFSVSYFFPEFIEIQDGTQEPIQFIKFYFSKQKEISISADIIRKNGKSMHIKEKISIFDILIPTINLYHSSDIQKHINTAKTKSNGSVKQKNNTTNSSTLDTIVSSLTEIYFEDRQELFDFAIQDRNKSFNDYFPNSKFHRFAVAFETFFDDIKLSRAEGRTIYFRKNKIDVLFENLSSGEQQIVIKGCELLTSTGIDLDKTIILIDEPELSLHPKWQERILTYYKDLLGINESNSNNQLIFSTHSDYVLMNALNDENSLVINLTKKRETRYFAKNKDPFILPVLTYSEIRNEIFNIPSYELHFELLNYLQHLIEQINDGEEISTKHLDEKLHSMGAPSKEWIKRGKVDTVYKSLPVYIRNYMGHKSFVDPNKPNPTIQELENSIIFLKDSILNKSYE